MSDMRQMQRFYRAIINTTSDIVGCSPRDLNDELKRGYNVITTTRMSPEEYRNYLDYTISMIAEAFEMLYDADRYRNEGISFIFLFDKVNNGNQR